MHDIRELQNQVTPAGIYFNMSNEDYHNDKSLSNSGMGNLLYTPKFGITTPTPKKYWWSSPFNKDREPLDTHALKTGRALHTLLLEPHKFHDEFKIKAGVKNTSKEGYIGEGAYNEIKKAVEAVKLEKNIWPLFQSGYPEVSIFWIDEETGVPCRARMDYLGLYIAADLKSTTNAYDLGYSIADFGYYRQAGLYLHGIQKIKELIAQNKAVVADCPDADWLDNFLSTIHDKFVFAFQEKTAPFTTRGEALCEQTVALGLERARHSMEVFKQNYEQYGESMWPTGFEGGVNITTLDELPQKIQY